MIIEPRIIVTKDVFVPNEGPNLRRWSETDVDLAAITLVVEAPRALDKGKLLCLQTAERMISSAFDTFSFWLLVGDHSWRPDTKRTRLLALWNALSRAGVPLPHGERGPEVIRATEEGVKFFGWAAVAREELETALSTIREQPQSMIVVTDGRPPVLEQYLDRGWAELSRDTPEFWAKMSQVAAAQGGCFVRAFGRFDDLEAGVDIIARPALIYGLTQRTENIDS